MNRRRKVARGPDWGRWLRRAMGGAAAAAAALQAAPALACHDTHGVRNNVNLGAHFGIAFGGHGLPVKLNYGFTLRLGRETAAFARVEGFGISAFQITGGATTILGGSGLLEGGIAGSTGRGSAGGLHLGAGPGGRAGGLLLGGFIPVVGDHGTFNLQLGPILYPAEICFPSGRALRLGEGIALPPVLAITDCVPADAVLAAAWVEDARAELASVPAFLRLASELRAVGAPAELRRRALAGAAEEQRHAAAALVLAVRWAGGALALASLDAPARFDGPSPAALTQLALEAWHDGCLGEATAALAARLGLARARDEEAARALARIAPDEARHAELSWQILEWCSDAGGPSVRDVLAGAARGATASSASTREDGEWLSWNGRLTTAERDSARAEIEEQARRRLRRMLAAAA